MPWGRFVLVSLLVLPLLSAGKTALAAEQDDPVQRGKYLFAAAGCQGCHTDPENKSQPLAGGRRLKTPYGVFVSPNISPDPTYGIGRWSDADFRRALRQGISPTGSAYYPVFPYPSYTAMADRDILDIKAYLFTLPPFPVPNRPHEIDFPYNLRILNKLWMAFFLSEGPVRPSRPATEAAFNRGEYLIRAVAHCGECHSPRNRLGSVKRNLALAGADVGPDGDPVPNITPDEESGIGAWSARDIADLLKDGMKPDGDFVGGAMGEVVADSTSKLTDEDRNAIAVFLKSLAPIYHRPSRPKS